MINWLNLELRHVKETFQPRGLPLDPDADIDSDAEDNEENLMLFPCDLLRIGILDVEVMQRCLLWNRKEKEYFWNSKFLASAFCPLPTDLPIKQGRTTLLEQYNQKTWEDLVGIPR